MTSDEIYILSPVLNKYEQLACGQGQLT